MRLVVGDPSHDRALAAAAHPDAARRRGPASSEMQWLLSSYQAATMAVHRQGDARPGGLGARPFRAFPSRFMEKAQKLKDASGTKPEETAATEAAPVSQEAKRQPVAVVRVEDCSASIWAREHQVQGGPKTFYSVTLERSYKDRDGAWRYTKSFDADSLGKVLSLCQQASETINGLQQQDAAK